MLYKKARFLFFLFLTLFFSLKYCATNYDAIWQNSAIFNYSRAYSSNPQITAYHESGHALVACLLNLRITKMTIVPTRKYAGSVKFIPQTKDKTLQVFLSGYAAEEIIFGETYYGIYYDLENAAKIAYELSKNEQFFPQNPKQILEQYLLQTKKLILDNLPTLYALAQEIQQKKTMNGQQVYQVFNNAKTNNQQNYTSFSQTEVVPQLTLS